MILDFKSVKPQHLRTVYFDLTPGITEIRKVLTVYTGQLTIGLRAEENTNLVDIVYPILGLFKRTRAVPGIVPVLPDVELIGAVAMAAMAGFVDKTDPAVWEISDVTVDLREVILRLRPGTSGDTIHAMVLSGRAKAQESEVATLQYQVTVLSNFQGKQLAVPTLVGDPRWDGTYVSVGPILARGVPSEIG
jgi:hypothetical protein